MKNFFYALVAGIILTSCSQENLYSFKDLTSEEDYIYLVRVYANDSVKKMDFKVRVSQTNGYDEILESYSGRSTGGNETFYTTEYSVKGYKENGVLVMPEENISAVLVRLYEVGSSNTLNGMVFQHFSENSEPFYIGYNFETNERIIEYREE